MSKETKKTVRRGDIFYADLSPVVGSEQGGVRPVLILQNNTGNCHSPATIVCAITGKPKKFLPTHAAIAGEGILPKESFALLELIRTIARMRLREWVGCLGAQEMVKINQALMISVGLNPSFFLIGGVLYGKGQNRKKTRYNENCCKRKECEVIFCRRLIMKPLHSSKKSF